MFKDVYRSANNSINPPPELIEKVLSKKPKKKLHYYGVAKAAAVCLIFSGTVLLYPKISKDLETTKEETIIRPEVTQNVVSDTSVHTEVVMEDISTPAPARQVTPKPATPPPEQKGTMVTQKPASTPVPTPSETGDAVEDNSSITTQNSSIAAASETSEAITPEPAYTAEEETIPKASGGGGGGSSGGASTMKSRMVMISEKEATAIADNEFLSDFGDEFVTNSELSVAYDNGYTVTRKTTEIEASILVFDNGSFEKLY